jgi:hypothetical protein
MICCIVSCDKENIVKYNEPFLKKITNDIYYINSQQGNYCTFHSTKSHEERWKEALFLIKKPYKFFIFMTDKMFIMNSLVAYTEWSMKHGHTVFHDLKMIDYKNMMENTLPIHATKCPAIYIDQFSVPKLTKRIFIIHNIEGGGTMKYIKDICLLHNCIIIRNKKELLSYTFHPYDLILVQQLFTDIHPSDILHIYKETGVPYIICIHDFYWFHVKSTIDLKECGSGYLNLPIISKETKTLFNKASLVIHPSHFTKQQYDNYFPTHNTIVQPHNDIEVKPCKCIPLIQDTIRIGVHELSEYKGAENIKLLQKYTKYKKYSIEFVFLKYDETNWRDIKVHGMLHLNKWGETYCYALTKSLQLGVPILYNNIGAFRERIPPHEHYFKVADSESEYYDSKKLYKRFEEWLNYIIQQQGKCEIVKDNMIVHDLYKFLCKEEYNPIYKKIHEKVQPFAVYFPQFHRIKENDVNYYPGMTDAINLYHHNQTNPPLNEPILAPILEYNLTNPDIIKQQVNIAKNHGIYGFAIYYYWFSINDITYKHTIMEKCYDLLFQQSFPLFFIWANEDWTNNPSFNTTHKIINKYDTESVQKNSNHLMRYFKHPNYYKLNNKPVFYIHHPLHIPNIQDFHSILNKTCKQHGFDGVLLRINGMEDNDIETYDFHPNYKNLESTDNIRLVTANYTNYVNEIEKTNCLFFGFNNNPRFHFSKIKPCTVFINKTEQAQLTMIQKMTDGLVLINSWNEWGEDMAIEPGTLTKNNLLLMIKYYLINSLYM